MKNFIFRTSFVIPFFNHKIIFKVSQLTSNFFDTRDKFSFSAKSVPAYN